MTCQFGVSSVTCDVTRSMTDVMPQEVLCHKLCDVTKCNVPTLFIFDQDI